jgi:hypothetical protein
MMMCNDNGDGVYTSTHIPPTRSLGQIEWTAKDIIATNGHIAMLYVCMSV